MLSVAILITLAALGQSPTPPPAPAPAPAANAPPPIIGRVLATVNDARVNESSGVAVSRRRPGVLWTHNDSGDQPRFYALDLAGKVLGVWQVPQVKARDWEDCCSAELDGQPLLIAADVGDNEKQRDVRQLVVIAEPELLPAAAPADPAPPPPNAPPREARLLGVIPFTFEGPPQDCEAVALDRGERTVYFVAKTTLADAAVYALPWPAKLDATPTARPALARIVAHVIVGTVTGMDLSADGRRLVLCNYAAVFEYTRAAGETWVQALARPPRRLAVPPRKQGEAVCYSADGETLYLTSEGVPFPLIAVPVAPVVAAAPPAPAPAPPPPTPPAGK